MWPGSFFNQTRHRLSTALPDSFGQPVLIMVAIPFGIVGALLGHLLLGYNLSILSMFGIVELSGVVVNNSLLLIDRINRNRRRQHLLQHGRTQHPQADGGKDQGA